MKLLLALLLLNTTAYGRQYIQCADSNSWDRIVINLDGENSTLFMTTGVHDPDAQNTLKPLKLVEITDTHHYFQTEGEIQESIELSNADFGRASQYFQVHVTRTLVASGESKSKQLGCFSSIYDD